jgi:lysophospholipase L1-like esterase
VKRLTFARWEGISRFLTHRAVGPLAALSAAALLSMMIASPAGAASSPCRVVAFGDSITWGAYATRNSVSAYLPSRPARAHRVAPTDTTYPGDLARALHTTVCNYGVPGEITDQGLVRLPGVLRAARPRIVIIMEGVNDLPTPGVEPDILQHLATMVARVRKRHAVPVLSTILPTYYPRSDWHVVLNYRVRALNWRIRVMARHRHVVLADPAAAFRRVRHAWRLTVDHLHPNDRGYRLLARSIARVITRRHLLR